MNQEYLEAIVFSTILLTSIILISGIALAKVEGAQQEGIGSDDTGSTMPATSDTAIGGQITQMNLSGATQTNFWQGYYGEITGKLRLKNSLNQSMYNWTVSTAAGEIYATTATSITWSSLVTHQNCSALDDIFTPGATNDQVSDTFTNGSISPLVAGRRNVTAQTGGFYACTVDLYDNTETPNSNWEENILNDTTSYVFQTFIRNNQAGHNGTTDYQLIVPENAEGDSSGTTWYFYIEIT